MLRRNHLAASMLQPKMPKTNREALTDRVKGLWDAGLRYHRIAAEVGCPVKQVTKVLKYWHDQRGLPLPDGRKCRRGRWPAKAIVPEAPEWVERVKALRDQGLSSKKIAQQLKCGQKRIEAALNRWFQERGVVKPDRRFHHCNGPA